MKLGLKPSLRTNRRYILIKGKREVVERALLDYLGTLGWAKASPLFVEPEDKIKEEGEVILSVSRKEVDNARAAFEASSTGVKVVRVSGTLKGLAK